MKKIFRYLTGELNGYYVQAFAYFFNNAIKDIYTLFSRMHKLKIKFETDEDFNGDTDVPLTTEELYNLTTFSGLFQPKVSAEVNSGSIRLVPPEDASTYGIYSERGLLNRTTSAFEYFRLSNQQYANDITDIATDNLQATMIPPGATLLGYIWETDTDILDDEGKVKLSKLHSTVPADDTNFTPFYGNKYLHFAETFIQLANIPDEILLTLFKICQKIRYNGSSIETLCELTKALFPTGYLKIESIVASEDTPGMFILNVSFHGTDDNAFTKVSVFKLLLDYKFKQFLYNEEV